MRSDRVTTKLQYKDKETKLLTDLICVSLAEFNTAEMIPVNDSVRSNGSETSK